MGPTTDQEHVAEGSVLAEAEEVEKLDRKPTSDVTVDDKRFWMVGVTLHAGQPVGVGIEAQPAQEG